MINLRNSPFLWLALLLLVAFVLMDITGCAVRDSNLLLLLIAFLLCAIGSLLKYHPGRQIISTLLLSFCFLTAGSIRYLAFQKKIFPHQVAPHGGNIEACVKVVKVLKARLNVTTLHCETIRPADSNKKNVCTDKYVLVRIKGSGQMNIFPSDSLTVSGWINPLQEPQNPHAFDLRKYYKTLGIRHQIFCADTDVVYHAAKQSGLMNLSARWQNNLCQTVQAHTSPAVAQMTNALVFGDRSAMDEEIRDAFAKSGAMHVLSVSGMHMAIIYSMLYVILGAPGAGSLVRRIIRLSLYTTAIIIYVGLTGASPAVLRAGLMIFLYVLGKAMGWNTQIWNLLGFAAFVMLWINPLIWQNIGFQLSFLAMAGILLYAKPIIRYLSFRHLFLHRMWEVTAVSLAAQVFIIPIILHHFFQLPLTFVLSSLIAMPASYLVVFGTLLNIILSPLHLAGLWQCYDYAGRLFLAIMKEIAGLNPNMNFSMPFHTALLFLMSAVFLSAGLVYAWHKGNKIALALYLSGLLSLGWHRTIQWTTNDVTIYHSYKGTLVDMIISGHCISYQDSTLSDRDVEYSTRGNRVFRDVIQVYPLQKNTMLSRANWQFSSSGFHSAALSITFWNGADHPVSSAAPSAYVLMIACPDVMALKAFLITNKTNHVILPAHLNRRTTKEIISLLNEMGLTYWDIGTQGYYKIIL